MKREPKPLDHSHGWPDTVLYTKQVRVLLGTISMCLRDAFEDACREGRPVDWARLYEGLFGSRVFTASELRALQDLGARRLKFEFNEMLRELRLDPKLAPQWAMPTRGFRFDMGE